MPTVDRQRVRKSFQKGAVRYDHLTPLQQQVVEQLVAKLHLAAGEHLLDIGCGTGRLLAALAKRFDNAQLTGLDLAFDMLQQTAARADRNLLLVQGDAETLPFRDNSFHLIVSSSTFQWCDNLNRCFGEVYRCLKPSGNFKFALFGGKTFHELHKSWQHAHKICDIKTEAGHDGTHRFHTTAEINSALLQQGFEDVNVISRLKTEWYSDVNSMLQTVKQIGAGSSRPPKGGGLGWRRVFKAMAGFYEKEYGSTDGIPATYEVIYGEGNKAAINLCAKG